jgi:hypothetical protein
MGTRGFVGFVVDGTEKITYNHNDSYPGGLGVDVLGFARGDMQAAREQARALRLVTDDVPPTGEQKAALAGLADLGVGRQADDDWYVLLRRTQGDPAAILRSGYMIDSHDFPADSLFAEYGYVVDFDAGTFEAYRGFQTEMHDKGRFADQAPRDTGYHPVALVASWPLDNLPDDDVFVAVVEGDDEDAEAAR